MAEGAAGRSVRGDEALAGVPVSLAITPGEPAGVGPELLIRLAASARKRPWVAVADADLLAARARALDAQIRFDDDCDHPATQAGRLTVRHVPLDAESVPGRLDPRNAAYVLETLKLELSLVSV